MRSMISSVVSFSRCALVRATPYARCHVCTIPSAVVAVAMPTLLRKLRRRKWSSRSVDGSSGMIRPPSRECATREIRVGESNTDDNSPSWNHGPKLFALPALVRAAGVPCRPYYPPQDRNFPINIVTATVTVNAHHSLITRFLPGRCSAVVVLGQLTVDATRKHCHRTLVLGGQGDALAFTDGTETTVPLSPSSYGTGPEHVLASLARRGPCAPAGAPRTRPDAVPAGRRSRLVAGGSWPRRARDDRRQGPRGEQRRAAHGRRASSPGRNAQQGRAVAEMGAVSLGAAVGDGARGL